MSQSNEIIPPSQPSPSAEWGLEKLAEFIRGAGAQAGLLEALVLPSLRSRSPERRRAGLEDLRALTESAQELSQLLLSRTVRKLRMMSG